MAQRHIAVLLLTILLVPLAGAYCDTQAAEREVRALCNQTNASTVPAPGTGEVLLNGTSVEEVDCSRLDRYTDYTDCGLSTTTGPWPMAAAGVALLLVIPGILTRRAYRQEQDIAYPLTLVLAALLPGTAMALTLNGATQYPVFLLPALLVALGLPIAAGMMAVRRSGQRRRTLLMTLSAMALSITIGVLGTLQYTTIV